MSEEETDDFLALLAAADDDDGVVAVHAGAIDTGAGTGIPANLVDLEPPAPAPAPAPPLAPPPPATDELAALAAREMKALQAALARQQAEIVELKEREARAREAAATQAAEQRARAALAAALAAEQAHAPPAPLPARAASPVAQAAAIPKPAPTRIKSELEKMYSDPEVPLAKRLDFASSDGSADNSPTGKAVLAAKPDPTSLEELARGVVAKNPAPAPVAVDTAIAASVMALDMEMTDSASALRKRLQATTAVAPAPVATVPPAVPLVAGAGLAPAAVPLAPPGGARGVLHEVAPLVRSLARLMLALLSYALKALAHIAWLLEMIFGKLGNGLAAGAVFVLALGSRIMPAGGSTVDHGVAAMLAGGSGNKGMLLFDDACTFNITTSRQGIIEGSERPALIKSFTQGNGSLALEYMADFHRTLYNPLTGESVDTVMPWSYCPASAFEIASEIYLRAVMNVAIAQDPGLRSPRLLVFTPAATPAQKLTLVMDRRGLGYARYKAGPSQWHGPGSAPLMPNNLTVIDGIAPLSKIGKTYGAVGASTGVVLPLAGQTKRVNMLDEHLSPLQCVLILHGRGGHQSLKREIETIQSGAERGLAMTMPIEKEGVTRVTLTKPYQEAFVTFSTHGCDICAACRFKRATIGGQQEHAARPSIGYEKTARATLDRGEEGALDIAGPMPVKSSQFGYRFAALIKLRNRGNRFISGMVHHTQPVVQEHLQLTQALLRPYIGTLYIMRLDGASEFTCDEMIKYLSSEGDGTAAEFSAPYVHEQQPVERDWSTLARTAICGMRHGPGGRKSDWFDAMRDAVYKEERYVTRRPSYDDKNISAYERLTGSIPSYDLVLAFRTPVRFWVDPETRQDKLDEKARAGFFMGVSPTNGDAAYVWDGHRHCTAGGGIQLFEGFLMDTNAKGNARIDDAEWSPSPPAPPLPAAANGGAAPLAQRQVAQDPADQPTNAAAPAVPPIAQTRPRRAPAAPQAYAPTDPHAARRVAPDAVDTDRALRQRGVAAALAGLHAPTQAEPTSASRLPIFASLADDGLCDGYGALALLAGAEQAAMRSEDGDALREVTDFMDDGVLAACIVGDVDPADLSSIGVARELDGGAAHVLLATRGDEQRVVKINENLSMAVPRHYGDYMKSRDKPIWHARKKVEVQRLLAIPVATLIHKSQFPAEFDGPFQLVWAYDIRAANADKGVDEMLRPRICVGHTIRGGTDSTNDPITKYAGTVDMTTSKMMMCATAFDCWLDFSFDISQFHQQTPVAADARPIITTQPRGFEEEGPNSEPAKEMFWLLVRQMQGTRIASSAANAYLDELLIKIGGFRRAHGDSRFFVLWHPEHGGVRLAMLSDDGNGAAERQAGIDYTMALLRRRFQISKEGPWKDMRGFEVMHDRERRIVTMTATRLITEGVEELMPGELKCRPLGPAPAWLEKATLIDEPIAEGSPGYFEQLERRQWFSKATGWAIHVANVHVITLWALSVLGGAARSPSTDAVKALKYLLCYFLAHAHEGLMWSAEGCEAGIKGLLPLPYAAMAKVLNTPGTAMPKCLLVLVDADLQERSRYMVIVFWGGCPIYAQSRLQHSAAYDITDSEAFAYSIGSIMADVVRGRIEDMGYAELTEHATIIGGDNDATLRIAADAASAKRGLHIMRRIAHTRYLTEQEAIRGLKVKRDLNLADAGTHYITNAITRRFEPVLRGQK